MIDQVRVLATAHLSTTRAFERFTRDMSAWWPKEYTWSQSVLQTIGIEPKRDGLCFEIGPHGFRCDWGRILEWEPPTRLQFAWQISPRREPVPDPRRSSIVTVTFTPDGPDRSRIELTHKEFERHGSEALDYRNAMASAQGWPFILERFVQTSS